jgi:hypothetical protein
VSAWWFHPFYILRTPGMHYYLPVYYVFTEFLPFRQGP